MIVHPGCFVIRLLSTTEQFMRMLCIYIYVAVTVTVCGLSEVDHWGSGGLLSLCWGVSMGQGGAGAEREAPHRPGCHKTEPLLRVTWQAEARDSHLWAAAPRSVRPGGRWQKRGSLPRWETRGRRTLESWRRTRRTFLSAPSPPWSR